MVFITIYQLNHKSTLFLRNWNRNMRASSFGARMLAASSICRHRLSSFKPIDFITCHNSFSHFVEKPAALKEMERIQIPGGFL